jgi:hypothetical protein
MGVKVILIVGLITALFIMLTIVSYFHDVSTRDVQAKGDGKFQEVTAYDNGTIITTTYIPNGNGGYTEYQEVTYG